MRRKIYDKLLEWKKSHKGDTALLIEGARRIGKSYIVEEFARKEYESYILVDFSKVNPQVMEFFNLYLDDLDMLFMNLELYFRRKLTPRQTKGEEARSLVIFERGSPFLGHIRRSTVLPPCPCSHQALGCRRQTDVMTTLKQARLFPSRRMSRTSCCHPKNMPLKCFRWTLRSSCGRWVMKC